jgi:hypothetical protein
VPYRELYGLRELRARGAYRDAVRLDLDGPVVMSGQTPAPADLEYTDIECGLDGRPVLYTTASSAVSEVPAPAGLAGCLAALRERPGFPSGEAPRPGLRLCIRTDQRRIVEVRVLWVDRNATMYLEARAWEQWQ